MSKRPAPGDNKNLLLAVLLSALVLIGADYVRIKYFGQPETQPTQVSEQTLPGAPTARNKVSAEKEQVTASKVNAAEAKRIPIESGVFKGQIATLGGRVDTLKLPHYDQKLDGDKPIELLRPNGDDVFFFEAGWLGDGVNAPNGDTVWSTDDTRLTPENPVVLKWENAKGQLFTRTYSLEPGRYIVLVKDRVENKGEVPARLTHYAQLHRGGSQNNISNLMSESSYTRFIGPMVMFDNELHEIDYDTIKDKGGRTEVGQRGWAGMSTDYFLAAVVPDPSETNTVNYRYTPVGDKGFFSMDVQDGGTSLQPGGIAEHNYRVYAGPKSLPELEQEGFGLERAVDFGWYHIIAKVFHDVLIWFYDLVGNMGLAIIMLTVLIKLLLWPLSAKSYRSMAALKKLHPKITRLKEKYGDNREKMAMEMMALYKEHGVNPMSGCWPILIQIPIFFALYKVILISFEFRHAPFFGWIQDLSVADPYFVLPILMGLTMFVQMRLNPPATDPIQQKVMSFMPVLFTILFLSFPAGLVLYWTVNSILSVFQQWLMVRAVEELG